MDNLLREYVSLLLECVGYHGSRNPSVFLQGRYWLALNKEYAKEYAGPSGVVVEVPLPTKILDLSHLGIDVTCEELAEALEIAGINTSGLYLGFDGNEDMPAEEMHQRVPKFESAVVKAGYGGIKIKEWTYGIGETVSVRVLS